MQLVIVQMILAWEDSATNLRRLRELLLANRPQAGALVVLPEMFASGFSMNVNAIAGGDVEGAVAQLARELSVFIDAGVVNRAPTGKGLNESVIFGPDGSLLTRYAKLHPFTLAGEHLAYEAGREIVTFNWHEFTVAPFVCYDLRFPEIFRIAGRRGANSFTVIASWPDKRIEHWITLLRARAIENQAYVIGVNRVGDDPGPNHYPGRSLIVDPLGKVLVDAGERECVVAADVSIDQVNWLRSKFPSLKDMRDEFVGS